MSTSVVFWRHGQTDYNVAGRLQGQVDIPLNAVGHEQAAAAAQVLARLQPSRIITSDLIRARETAQALAQATGLAVEVDENLRERAFGEFDGLTHTEIGERFPYEARQWRRGASPVGMQTRGSVGQRVAEVAKAAVAAVDTGGGAGPGAPGLGPVVLVSHGAAISAGVSALLGEDPDTWFGVGGLGNCHWSVMHPRPDADPFWVLRALDVGVELHRAGQLSPVGFGRAAAGMKGRPASVGEREPIP